MYKKLLEELEKRLNKKTIHDLRQIGRAVGVRRPAWGKKELLLNGIMSIASGESDPVAHSSRGAPPKSEEYDRQLVADVMRCREICLAPEAKYDENALLSVSSGVKFDSLEFVAEGVLEKLEGKWFMRVGNGGVKLSVFVSDYYVQSFGLCEGDLLSGQCKRESEDEDPGLAALHSVNGLSPESVRSRPSFETLTPVYPDKQLFTAAQDDITGRLVGLLAPLGAGQRAVISGAAGTGKTTVLKKLAQAIKRSNPAVRLAVVSIDARVEEAAELTRLFPDAQLFISPFGSEAAESVRLARLALEFCKRQAEAAMDAVLILDGVTRLAYAMNSYGNLVEPRLDCLALEHIKKYIASARNLKEGGSLTVITSALTDGGGVEQVVYSALNGICNAHIALSKRLARMRVFPAVDMENTYSGGDEGFASGRVLALGKLIRSKSTEEVIQLLSECSDDELLKKLG